MSISTLNFVLRITWKGAILGEAAYNVFYYGCGTEPTSVDDVLIAQKEAVWNVLQPILSTKASLDQVVGEGVKGTTRFSSIVPAELGSVSGDCLPPYAAYGFTLLRDGVGERNGYKRFAGVPESYQIDGHPTGTVSANLPAIQAALAADLTVGDETWTPLIRRTRVHKVVQNPPTYWNQGSVVFGGITTQSSRKYGHGI